MTREAVTGIISTAEQRGYDRAIAEVVAWLRAGAPRSGAWIEEEQFEDVIDAIEAGEHKP